VGLLSVFCDLSSTKTEQVYRRNSMELRKPLEKTLKTDLAVVSFFECHHVTVRATA